MNYKLTSILPVEFIESPGVLMSEISEKFLQLLIYGSYSSYLSFK